MKHDTTMQDGMRAALHAMAHMLNHAARHAIHAHHCMQRNEQNLAIGTVVPVEDAIEKAMTLYKAIMAMHRFKG